jgi:thioredoxin reductase (NADPH)
MADQIIGYSTVWCPDCKRTKKFLGDHRIPYENIDIEQDEEAMDFVQKINHGMRIIPTILFPDGSTLSEPSNAQLAAKLGMQSKATLEYYDSIVVGGGPSGLTAAIYMAREGLDVLIIEKAGLGGQVGITQTLDNFPGFHECISGSEFADRLVMQARLFGVEIMQAQEVSLLQQNGDYWEVNTSDGQCYCTKAVLLATGAR